SHGVEAVGLGEDQVALQGGRFRRAGSAAAPADHQRDTAQGAARVIEIEDRFTLFPGYVQYVDTEVVGREVDEVGPFLVDAADAQPLAQVVTAAHRAFQPDLVDEPIVGGHIQPALD